MGPIMFQSNCSLDLNEKFTICEYICLEHMALVDEEFKLLPTHCSFQSASRLKEKAGGADVCMSLGCLRCLKMLVMLLPNIFGQNKQMYVGRYHFHSVFYFSFCAYFFPIGPEM